jgi:hypothetical protein
MYNGNKFKKNILFFSINNKIMTNKVYIPFIMNITGDNI